MEWLKRHARQLLRHLSPREGALALMLTLMLLFNVFMFYAASVARESSRAQYHCANQAKVEFLHGHETLAYKYLDGSIRAYVLGYCSDEAVLRLELHPNQ